MHGGIGMTDDEEIGFFLKRSVPRYTRYRWSASSRPLRSIERLLIVPLEV